MVTARLGDPDGHQFKLAKNKKMQKVGNVSMRLTNADTKKNRYTIQLIADDKQVEKKDKNVNEPLQFYVAGARTPYEIVVNQISKDLIVGYLATPKVQHARIAPFHLLRGRGRTYYTPQVPPLSPLSCLFLDTCRLRLNLADELLNLCSR